MATLIYWFFLGVVGVLQRMPLVWVARLGRLGGAAAWIVDGRHRRMILSNMRAHLPEIPEAQVARLARENMLRIGEAYASAARTSCMTPEEVLQVCDTHGVERLAEAAALHDLGNCVVAIGHFGNFEVNAILGNVAGSFTPATTYRGIKQAALNKLLLRLREKSGCLYFERRTQSKELMRAMAKGGMLLGILSDQNASLGGIRLPFLGAECSTTTAPAVLALRYDAPLFTAVCYRTAPGRWSIEVGEEIPTHRDGEPRPVEELMLEVNRAFEVAVRRDPANWFWVHNRWKSKPVRKTGPPPGEGGAVS